MNEDHLKLLAAAVLISLATAVVLLGARQWGLLEPLELMSYDLMMSLHPAPGEPTHITLVAVTEDDIAAQGHWPLSDAALAAALGAIMAQRPRVVGLDIYRDLPVPPGTDTLETLLATEAAITGIFKFDSPGSPGVAAPATLARAGRVGFSDVVLDDGAMVRRALAFLDDGKVTAASLSLQLALAYLAAEGVRLAPDPIHPAHFRLGETTFTPLDPDFGGYVNEDSAGYQFLIDYSRGSGAFPRYSYGDLMSGRIDAEHLRDRIVILGVDAESVKDSFATPLGQWPWSPGPSLPGVELHAHITDQLLRSALTDARPMSSWGVWMESLLVLAACLAGGLASLASRSARRLVLVAVAGIGVISAAGFVLFVADLWAPTLPMAVGWVAALAVITGYLLQRTGRDRAALQRLLSLQVSPAVAATIWQRRDELLQHGVLRPQQLTATVLFMDLQGFTQLTESLAPDELMAWLQPIMDVTTRTVLAHGGMLDDYFGDGIKANFGVPFAGADCATDARRAVSCALALMAEAQRLSPRDRPYVLRIGINTGPLIAASVGSSERLKYTSIGDTVNVAARLEALVKEPIGGAGGSGILVSAATAQLVVDEFDVNSLGAVTLRGKSRSINVFRVIGPRDHQVPQGREQLGT